MERSEPERGGSMSLEKLLQKNGAYSLPFLVKISNHGDTESIRIVNDVNDVVYQGKHTQRVLLNLHLIAMY